MLSFIIYNGEIFSAEHFKTDLKNRLFLYGDGLFETMMTHHGNVLFLKDHFKRMNRGMNVLGLENNVLSNYKSFRQLLALFIKKNNITLNARIRLSIFRHGEDRYQTKTDESGFVLWGENYEEELYSLKTMNSISVFDDLFKTRNILSPIKTANSLLYVMAARFAEKNNLDEVIILNDKKQAIEGYRSNLFWVKSGILYTSSIKSGAMDGVMRKQIIRIARKSGIKIVQQKIKSSDLLKSDEIFYTNTIQGIMSVKTKSSDSLAIKINNLLRSEIGL